jgi:hypothetical protein
MFSYCETLAIRKGNQMSTVVEERYLTITEAAKELGLSYWALQKHVHKYRSELKTRQLGRNVLVGHAAIE